MKSGATSKINRDFYLARKAIEDSINDIRAQLAERLAYAESEIDAVPKPAAAAKVEEGVG